ncbi:MAG TPA: endonuclease/exonuclease/phosphatase family protein [Phenylobacterium sp.]|jgi:endonuclease/exonuclease/phosphatase (EEP) superfamily protein YafD
MPFARLVFTAILGPPVLVGAILCAAAAGLAQLGRRSVAWDVLAHAAPIYLAGGLVALACGLAFHDRYRPLTLVAGGAAVIAAALLMAPEYLRATGPKAAADAPGAFKLIQFNIWGGEGGVRQPVAWLAAQHPDVVVMQETNRRVREAVVAGTGLHMTLSRSNVAIFSREPPVSVLRMSTEREGPMFLVGATFRTPAGDADILGVHYPWPTERDRLVQAADLIGVVNSHPAATTILSGDFNSTPWSFTRRREDAAFRLTRRTRAMFSWPAWRNLPLPLMPIDHVYAGDAWATVSVTRGPKLGSDHYPVVVILAPRAPPPASP